MKIDIENFQYQNCHHDIVINTVDIVRHTTQKYSNFATPVNLLHPMYTILVFVVWLVE